jgi:hypothetical protein
VKRIQVYSNKRLGPLQRGDNHKNEKKWGGAFEKSSSPEPPGQF